MRLSRNAWPNTPVLEDPSLSQAELVALQEACAPVGLLHFPPPTVIRTLRQYGYVEIVLGGIQITREGLERLLRERKRGQSRLPL